MRHLFIMDYQDYDPAGTRKYRPSVRAIVIRDEKVLMIHSRKHDYYKFPGGGLEAGESHNEGLCREVAEESGFCVVPGSIREYGLVRKICRDGEREIFDQENFYYLCDVRGSVMQNLDDYEADEGFSPNLSPRREPSKPTVFTIIRENGVRYRSGNVWFWST